MSSQRMGYDSSGRKIDYTLISISRTHSLSKNLTYLAEALVISVN